MTAVWDMDDGSPEERLVLLAYADHADDTGASIFPAVARVAKKTGLSERSVQRVTRRLEASGMLISEGAGPKGTRRWRIPLPVGGDRLSPLTHKPEGVTPVTPRGDIAVSPNPSLTINKPSLSRPNGRTDPIRLELEEHFCKTTGLPRPKTGTEREKKAAGALWWAPLRETLELGGDVDKAKRLLSEVVKRMKNDRLTISDPNSTIKIARAIAAQVNKANEIPEYIIPPNMRMP